MKSKMKITTKGTGKLFFESLFSSSFLYLLWFFLLISSFVVSECIFVVFPDIFMTICMNRKLWNHICSNFISPKKIVFFGTIRFGICILMSLREKWEKWVCLLIFKLNENKAYELKISKKIWESKRFNLNGQKICLIINVNLLPAMCIPCAYIQYASMSKNNISYCYFSVASTC